MASLKSGLRPLLAAILAVSFTGCASYVKRDEFDATVSDCAPPTSTSASAGPKPSTQDLSPA